MIRKLLYVGGPVALVLVGTFFLYREAHIRHHEKFIRDFTREATEQVERLSLSLASYTEGIESIASLYHASQFVDRDEFRSFTHRVLKKFPSIQALEWIPRVPGSNREEFEAAAVADGLDSFRFRRYQPGSDEPWVASEEQWSNEYFPVYYVEPLAGNEPALGIDLGSHPARRAAMEQARDSGEPRASRGIRLAQAVDASPEAAIGVLYFSPVYQTAEVPLTLEERRQLIQGFSLGVLRFGTIVSDVLHQQGDARFIITILDITDPGSPEDLYHDSGKVMTDPGAATQLNEETAGGFVFQNELIFGGRRWLLTLTPTPLELSQLAGAGIRPWLYLGAGLVVSVLLGILLNVIIGRAAAVELLVKRRTQELERAELRFKTLFDSSGTGMLLADKSGVIRLVNKAVQQAFGYENDELAGKKVEMLIPKQYRTKHEQYRQDYVKDPVHRPMSRAANLWGLHKMGAVFPIEADLTPVEVFGQSMVLASITDITERRQSEAALAAANANLRRSNEELQQFAYVASHDLQEPLRAINSFSQLIAKRYTGKLDEDGDEFIEFITSAAHRAQALIQDLLAYSRVGTHGKPFVETDCQQVLDAVLDNLQLVIEERNARIEHDPLPRVMGDEVQLIQLFQNLLGNALKFQADGQSPHVQIRVRQLDSGEWQFGIQDNGIGIEPEFFDRIFVIFQRLHGVDEYKGTGIGLAICKKIVERHGGRIWVESQVGSGTTFLFTIAAAAASSTPASRDLNAAADEDIVAAVEA